MDSTEKRMKRFFEDYYKMPFLAVNKYMIGTFDDANKAIILANLIEKCNLHFKNGKLKKGKMFYLTNENQSYDTGLSVHKIKVAKKQLKEQGYFTTKTIGIPSKEYYELNWPKLRLLITGKLVNKANPRERKISYLENGTSASYINKNKLNKKDNCISYNLKRTKFAYKDTSIKKYNSSTLENNNTSQSNKSKAERIIKYWNNIDSPNITRHNNPNAKIYQSTVQMLDNMLQGLPIICKKDGFPHAKLNDFAQMYNIPPEVIEKPWKPIEIKKKLKQLAGQQTQKTSLQALLWNGHPDPKKCFSQILYEQSIEQLPDEYYELADQFFETLAVEPTRKDQIQAARHFEKLSKERHLQNDQLKTECLDLFAWLKKHRHEKYTPTVYSVYDFAEKYDKIKGQKERESKPTVKNKNGLHTDWEPGKESKVWKPVYE